MVCSSSHWRTNRRFFLCQTKCRFEMPSPSLLAEDHFFAGDSRTPWRVTRTTRSREVWEHLLARCQTGPQRPAPGNRRAHLVQSRPLLIFWIASTANTSETREVRAQKAETKTTDRIRARPSFEQSRKISPSGLRSFSSCPPSAVTLHNPAKFYGRRENW